MRRTLSTLALILLAGGLIAGGAHARQVQLDARLGHPVLPADQKTKTWLKVGLTGYELGKAQARTPVNVALVLDKSGSMSGEKIQRAKEAARVAVDQLASDDIVSVIAYDSRVRVLVPATKASDKERIRDGINQLSPGGNTALFAGVTKGADELNKFLDRNRVNRVILMSDGLANVGPSSPGDLKALGARLSRQGISVTTLGLGLDYNEDLMSGLSRASDGNHAFVERANDLVRFFNLEFGDVMSVVAKDVTVTIDCAPGVRPVRVLGREADIVGQRVTTRLNQLISRREKFVLLEVEIPPGEHHSDRPVASISVSYGNMSTQSTDTLSRKVQARFSKTPSEVRSATDKDVMVKAVELLATEKNRMAVVLRDQGRIDEARQMLNDNAVYLETNFKKWGSSSLKDLSTVNEDDAKNLAPKKWNRQRKKMRRKQYQFDMQQSY
jgi:Ca-activated chloride channel family protein